ARSVESLLTWATRQAKPNRGDSKRFLAMKLFVMMPQATFIFVRLHKLLTRGECIRFVAPPNTRRLPEFVPLVCCEPSVPAPPMDERSSDTKNKGPWI